jgi:error-prone DNA polymerase
MTTLYANDKIKIMSYTELQITTNFSFLRGASHPEELVEQAVTLGYKAIAITDRNSFAGIVRAAAAKKMNIRVITLSYGFIGWAQSNSPPTNIDAYAQLCSLLTVGNLRAEKGDCHLNKADVYQHRKGLNL